MAMELQKIVNKHYYEIKAMKAEGNSFSTIAHGIEHAVAVFEPGFVVDKDELIKCYKRAYKMEQNGTLPQKKAPEKKKTARIPVKKRVR